MVVVEIRLATAGDTEIETHTLSPIEKARKPGLFEASEMTAGAARPLRRAARGPQERQEYSHDADRVGRLYSPLFQGADQP